MAMNIKERLASVFQKASRENTEDFDTQILGAINSVLEEKNADFRLGKKNGLIGTEKQKNNNQ